MSECTGIAAAWCPIHGGCTCDELPCEHDEDCGYCSGEFCHEHGNAPCRCDAADRHPVPSWTGKNRPDCPVHGDDSDHPRPAPTMDDGIPPEVRERARKIVTGVLDGVERDIQYFTTTAKPHPVVDVRLVLAKPAATADALRWLLTLIDQEATDGE